MCNKEIVICAAIWVQDGKKRPYQPTNIPSGTVFCGLRHPSILSQLTALCQGNRVGVDFCQCFPIVVRQAHEAVFDA